MPLSPQQAQVLAEQLLDDEEEVAGEPPTASGPTDDAGNQGLPQQIGSYRILRIIASGGMGVVYEAEQQHPRRVVALKVLKHGLSSHTALRRFEYETQVLARLRHDGIAHIYEAGTHDDPGAPGKPVPYFAMEFIPNARSIVQFTEDYDLSFRQRLELFAAACDAIHHGHQKGIIHRDLKPANILVEGTAAQRHEDTKGQTHKAATGGRVKVIDIGIARATDADVALTTLQTDVRQLIGTLQYMSPEQCAGDPHDLDIRSDIYSLGVVLYELLTGHLPYDLSHKSLPSATRMIAEADPLPPSSFVHKLRGDIDAILLKTLQKDREKRYQSAMDLCRDVRRFLQGEPIEARRPSRWSLTMRWVAKHPIAITTMVCILIAAASLTSIQATIWYAHSRPHRIERATDASQALLFSFSGNLRYAWPETNTVPESINFTHLIDHPIATGGKNVALIGMNQQSKDFFAGQMCAFDADHPSSKPLWVSGISMEEIIAPFRNQGYDHGSFGVASCSMVADVFPELEGPEVIAIYGHDPRSAAVVRVLDLRDGTVLYEIWHDGIIVDAVWLPGAGQIVLLAWNSEVSWPRRGYPNLAKPSPTVIFAAHPQLGHLGQRLVSPSTDGDLTTIDYYRCLLPVEAADWFGQFYFSKGHAGDDMSLQARIVLCLRDNPTAGSSFLIDETGQIMPGSHLPDDQYQIERDRNPDLPDPESLYLGDLPPIISTPE